jgi:hypothetical protein
MIITHSIPLTLSFRTTRNRDLARDKLSRGSAVIQVEIDYSAYALITERRSIGRLFAVKAHETSAWRDLSGNGPGHTVGLHGDNQAISTAPMLVTLVQREGFAAAVKQELSAEYQLDGDDLTQMQTQVDDYVKQLFGNETPLSFDEVIRARDRWSACGFDPKDLATSVISSLSANLNVKNRINTEDSSTMNMSVGTSASVMQFSQAHSKRVSSWRLR